MAGRPRDPTPMTRDNDRTKTRQVGSAGAGAPVPPSKAAPTPDPVGQQIAQLLAKLRPERRREGRSLLRHPRLGLALAAALLVTIGIVAWEMHTSALQSRWFSKYASRLTWDVVEGACEQPLTAPTGPYDQRLGYANLLRLQQKLTARDFRVARQACPSPELVKLAERGIAPPYDEKATGLLHIFDREGKDLYRASLDEFAFGDLNEIPALVVQSLLFVEDRHLLSRENQRANPAVEWDRLFLAGTRYAVDRVVDTGTRVQGGSTLATQLEKFRHSPQGRTSSGGDKVRQIFGASLRAYRAGEDTRSSRRDIVLDYVNSMPLGAAPEMGEVIGLGQGMWAWFGKKPEDIRQDLTLTEEDRNLKRKAETYKQTLALIMATRRPATYLGTDREQLELRMASYLPLLVEAGILSERLAAATLEAPLRFNQKAPARKRVAFVDRKATNAVRTELLDLLDVGDLYTLDRYDLSVETSIDAAVQQRVTSVLRKLASSQHAGAMGLYGKHLLGPGNDPSKVVYSFSLYEAAEDGNRLRVSADTFDKPMDINRNVKLELGSTAKLRTMANYLSVIADLHETYRRTPREVLGGVEQAALDPISRWTAGYMRMNPGVSLEKTLQASLERSFSTDTSEGFFTGSGLHYFGNFEDSLVAQATLRNAFQHSINLVYIRLMREIEQYYVAKLDFDQKAILADIDHPQRADLLEAALEIEARDNLRSYFRRYGKSSFEQSLARMCGKEGRGLRRLAIFALAEEPTVPYERVRELAERTYPGMSAAQDSLLRGYYRTFTGRIRNAQDEAYLLGRNELEVWLVRDRRDHPETSWADVLRRSSEARERSGRWIRGRNHREAQNLRIRTELERRAFVEIHKQWRALGYPFASLVPSLATAIGSSADRPQALAELVGIIQRGGRRVPFLRVESLHFGAGTPYETHFEPAQSDGEQVMAPEVAAALEKLMRSVVEGGTARRVYGSLRTASDKAIPIGGKTGSGDNRYEKFASNGALISSRAINRTASFVFVVGERYFGMISAYVDGEAAGDYSFTSSLALQAFRNVADAIEPMVRAGEAQGTLAAQDAAADGAEDGFAAPAPASAAPAVAAAAVAPASAAVAVAARP